MRSNFIRYEIKGDIVTIIPTMEGVLTEESYIRLAKNLLENGISKVDSNLKDEGSPALTENQLLLHEEMNNRQTVRTVKFSIGSVGYEINKDNINSYISKLPHPIKNPRGNENQMAVDEAIQELRWY